MIFQEFFEHATNYVEGNTALIISIVALLQPYAILFYRSLFKKLYIDFRFDTCELSFTDRGPQIGLPFAFISKRNNHIVQDISIDAISEDGIHTFEWTSTRGNKMLSKVEDLEYARPFKVMRDESHADFYVFTVKSIRKNLTAIGQNYLEAIAKYKTSNNVFNEIKFRKDNLSLFEQTRAGIENNFFFKKGVFKLILKIQTDKKTYVFSRKILVSKESEIFLNRNIDLLMQTMTYGQEVKI